MPFNNEEIAEIAEEAASDIRLLLKLEGDSEFAKVFEPILEKLDKLALEY